MSYRSGNVNPYIDSYLNISKKRSLRPAMIKSGIVIYSSETRKWRKILGEGRKRKAIANRYTLQVNAKNCFFGYSINSGVNNED